MYDQHSALSPLDREILDVMHGLIDRAIVGPLFIGEVLDAVNGLVDTASAERVEEARSEYSGDNPLHA